LNDLCPYYDGAGAANSTGCSESSGSLIENKFLRKDVACCCQNAAINKDAKESNSGLDLGLKQEKESGSMVFFTRFAALRETTWSYE
jgi:hypothetical protein